MHILQAHRWPLLAAAATVAASLALTGCSADPGNGSSDQKVTIDFWGWVPSTEKVVTIWNEQNPNIQVNYTKIDSATAPTKLLSAVKAGNAPCIAQIGYTEVLNNVVNGELMEVTTEAAQYKSSYVPFAWSFVSPGGKTYGIPQDTGPVVMYYRTDLFKKYGITVPTTWDQYAAAAEKVHKADPTVALGSFSSTDSSGFTALAWQNNAQWFQIDGSSWSVDIESAPTKQVAEYWQKLVDDKSIPLINTSVAAYNQSLANGKILSTIAPSWQASLQAGNLAGTSGKWAVARMPSWGSTPTSANTGGSADAIIKGCAYPAQALKFANWMNSTEASMNVLASLDGGGLYPAAVEALSYPVVHQKSAFYGGQDLGDVFASAAKSVPADWNWGPVTVQNQQYVATALAAMANGDGALSSQLPTIQSSTLAAMKAKGISAHAAQ